VPAAMPFQIGDVVRLRSGGLPMTVVAVVDIGVKIPYVDVKVFWHNSLGVMQAIDIRSECLELVSGIATTARTPSVELE
jgi:uncharacterized protein YodC (DUF2158 family)